MAQPTHSLPNPSFPIAFDSITDRVRGTITFHRMTIAGIAADRRATLEAVIVVAIVGVATAIGDRDGISAGIANAILGWLMLSATVWYLAGHMLGTPTSRGDLAPLLRTIGYALAPVSLGIIAFVWGFGPMVAGAGTIWAFLATIAAVRYTTRFGWGRSAVLTVAGGLVVNIVGFMLSLATGIDPHIW